MAKRSPSSKILKQGKVTETGASRSASMPRVEQEQRWQAENDLRTITEAHEVLSDHKRRKAAKALSDEKASRLDEMVKGKKTFTPR